MSLSDAFNNPENQPSGLDAFGTAPPPPDFSPLPPGSYFCRVLSGEVSTTKKGEDSYRMKFEVMDGDHAGRTILRIWTFTPKALPYTQQGLAAFGLTTKPRLLSPYPTPGTEVTARLMVAVQVGPDGMERNDIKRIDRIETKKTPAAAFVLPPKDTKGGK